MIKIQYQFNRTRELRLLSHLDQQRLFQRAFRRGDMPVEYSLGFNPHPKMSFALAMSVGLTSDCEYGDVVLSEGLSCDDFVKRMNVVLPKGLTVLNAKICGEGKTSLSASITKSQYELVVKLTEPLSLNDLSNAFNTYLAYPNILIQKRNKKGKLVEKDIRPFIDSLSIISEETTDQLATIDMSLCYIEQQSVKPELILASINAEVEDLFIIDPTIQIHRKQLILEEHS